MDESLTMSENKKQNDILKDRRSQRASTFAGAMHAIQLMHVEHNVNTSREFSLLLFHVSLLQI